MKSVECARPVGSPAVAEAGFRVIPTFQDLPLYLPPEKLPGQGTGWSIQQLLEYSALIYVAEKGGIRR